MSDEASALSAAQESDGRNSSLVILASRTKGPEAAAGEGRLGGRLFFVSAWQKLGISLGR